MDSELFIFGKVCSLGALSHFIVSSILVLSDTLILEQRQKQERKQWDGKQSIG